MTSMKMMTLTVAVMVFFAFATVPAAEAFVYPAVAIPIMAAVYGTVAFVATEIVEENETKEPEGAEGETPSADEGALTAESAADGR
jgi:hypothetical protein